MSADPWTCSMRNGAEGGRWAGRDVVDGASSGAEQESTAMEGSGGEEGTGSCRKRRGRDRQLQGVPRRLCVGLCLWLSWIGVGQAGAMGWPGRVVVQLDFPVLLGGSNAIPPSPSKPSWDDETSNHRWRLTLRSFLKRLHFCYFSLRNSRSSLFLFSLRMLHPSILGLGTDPEQQPPQQWSRKMVEEGWL